MAFDKLDDKDVWRFADLRTRYRELCRHYKIDHKEIDISDYALERGWAAGALYPLIERMRDGDLAAAEIGIAMMEENRGLAFGSILKSRIPRALARCSLTEQQKDRIRRRTAEMLLVKFLPKEFRQYAWLTRRIGLGEWQSRLDKEADCSHPWVNWYLRYLMEDHPPRQPERGLGRTVELEPERFSEIADSGAQV